MIITQLLLFLLTSNDRLTCAGISDGTVESDRCWMQITSGTGLECRTRVPDDEPFSDGCLCGRNGSLCVASRERTVE
jgi:hypothetical protein